jgi:hypothetical protein
MPPYSSFGPRNPIEGNAQAPRMNYFYDHETDSVSLLLGDFIDYASTEQLAPGVVMYVDGRKKPLAIDVRPASKVLDTAGLVPMYERPISKDEVKQRLSASLAGQTVLRTLTVRSDALSPQ